MIISFSPVSQKYRGKGKLQETFEPHKVMECIATSAIRKAKRVHGRAARNTKSAMHSASIHFISNPISSQPSPRQGTIFLFPSLSFSLSPFATRYPLYTHCIRTASILRMSILNSNYSPLISREPSLRFITIRTRLAPQNFVLALFVPVTYSDKKREERDLS